MSKCPRTPKLPKESRLLPKRPLQLKGSFDGQMSATITGENLSGQQSQADEATSTIGSANQPSQ